MTRKRSKQQQNKKPKKNQNQMIYFMITIFLIIAAIAALFLVQGLNEGDINETNDTNLEPNNDGTWLFAMDTADTRVSYQISVIPTLAIIDKDGNIIFYDRGVHTSDQLRSYIELGIEGTAEGFGSAPDFTLTTFGGNTFKLSDYQGKVVLLDFMAEYCDPCKIQMPELQKLQLEIGDDLVMLSINVAYPQETEELVRDVFGQYIKEA